MRQAKRAADLDAYRKMIQLVHNLQPFLVEGHGDQNLKGFIKGATTQKISQKDNHIEVELVLPVTLTKNIEGSILPSPPNSRTTPSPVQALDLDQSIFQIDQEDWDALLETAETIPSIQKGEKTS